MVNVKLRFFLAELADKMDHFLGDAYRFLLTGEGRKLEPADSINANTGPLDYLGPFCGIRLDQRSELRGSSDHEFEAVAGESLSHLSDLKDLRDFGVEPRNNFFGRPGWNEHAYPGDHLIPRDPCFRDGWQIGCDR